MIDYQRCGAYFIFPDYVRHLYDSGTYSRAALISATGKTLSGIQRELSEAHARYAQFNINNIMYTLNGKITYSRVALFPVVALNQSFTVSIISTL